MFIKECMLSFDTPYSPGGLYTNLKTWHSFRNPIKQYYYNTHHDTHYQAPIESVDYLTTLFPPSDVSLYRESQMFLLPVFLSEAYVGQDHELTGSRLYLHTRKIKPLKGTAFPPVPTYAHDSCRILSATHQNGSPSQLTSSYPRSYGDGSITISPPGEGVFPFRMRRGKQNCSPQLL